MTKIFISYRRDDSAGHAGRIYEKLCETFQPDDVFYDTSTITDGAQWDALIRQNLESSKLLIAVIGKRWLSPRLFEPGDYVRLEISTALERSIPVIPVFVDGAEPPPAADLPADLQTLSAHQGRWLNHRSHASYESDLNHLIANIRQQFITTLAFTYIIHLIALKAYPLEIFANDQLLGRLWHGQTDHYEIMAGEYTLQVRMPVDKSEPLKFNLKPGETRRFEAGSRAKNFALTELFIEEV